MATTALRLRLAPGRGEKAPAPRRTVPCMQTAWPHMLSPRLAATVPLVFPFDQPGLRYRYFARNAVWDAVRMLGLAGRKVLMPAYHHGVELETLLAAGVTPVFFRVDAQMRADFEDARGKSDGAAALYLIHYAGFPQDMQAARQLAGSLGVPLIEDCALSLLSRDGEKPLGSFGDLSVFCLYKTLPVPNGGALLARGDYARRLESLPPVKPPPLASTASHLIGGLLSNLELRTGEAGRRAREALRDAGRWLLRRANVERVSTGTQHFNPQDVELGMSAASHLLLRNQDFARIVERRRRNYFLLYAMLRDVAPPVTGELKPGVCPLFYPMPVDDKAGAIARLLARGVETVDFWRLRHPLVPAGAFPEVDRLRERVLELPVHQDLSPADAEHVASCVRELLK
ncbi:MAG TPA: DegT/DnrJ/EryC1/StrS family aminotransferase [Myxococcales bacterium]|nr:DegT/DnrJ/EryC1/StrS family aminotransferase [Myxococcales bacterium]